MGGQVRETRPELQATLVRWKVCGLCCSIVETVGWLVPAKQVRFHTSMFVLCFRVLPFEVSARPRVLAFLPLLSSPVQPASLFRCKAAVSSDPPIRFNRLAKP
jgi:hypothetical protein